MSKRSERFYQENLPDTTRASNFDRTFPYLTTGIQGVTWARRVGVNSTIMYSQIVAAPSSSDRIIWASRLSTCGAMMSDGEVVVDDSYVYYGPSAGSGYTWVAPVKVRITVGGKTLGGFDEYSALNTDYVSLGTWSNKSPRQHVTEYIAANPGVTVDKWFLVY